MMRAVLERSLRTFAAPAEGALRRTGLRAGVALVYHRVGDPPGDPERELVPNHGTGLFEEQLRYLGERYRLVAPSELVEAAAARRRRQPFPVAITFDDDLRGHRRVALPILRRLGVPAAFFLCGASLDRPHAFWWERLQAVADREGTRREVKAAAAAVEALLPERLAEADSDLAERLGGDPPGAGMPAEDVEAVAGAGFEVGFHTLRHLRLTGLSDDPLGRALTEGRERLEEVAGRPLRSISYPHGKADARVAAQARAAGFALGFTGLPEAIRVGSDPLLLGRVEPSFRATDELAVQLVRALGRG